MCFQDKKQQLEPDMDQLTGSKLGQEYNKAVYCHPVYLTYMQSISCEMLGWMNPKLESRLLGEVSNNLKYADDTTLMAESKEKLKSLLMRVKQESEKTDLKFNSKNTKIMASGPIISWQIEGENVWSSNRLRFLGSKITVDGNCNYEIKKHLLLERETKAKLDSILKSRDTSLLIKVHIVKARIFFFKESCMDVRVGP